MLLVHQYRRQVQAPDAAKAGDADLPRFRCCVYCDRERWHGPRRRAAGKRRAESRFGPIKARGRRKRAARRRKSAWPTGRSIFRAAAAFLFELEKELLAFPRSDYADQVDALSHAAMQVQRMTRSITLEPEAWERDAVEALEADAAWEAEWNASSPRLD